MSTLGRGVATCLVSLVFAVAMPALAQQIDATITRISPNGFKPQWIAPDPKVSRARILSEIDTRDAYASVGRGFDPVTNTILDIQCVQPMPGTEAKLPGTITITDQSVVNDVKTHASVSGSNFSAGAIIKEVSLGFGSSNSQGDYFNQVDTYVRLYTRAATEGKEWRDVMWTDDALKLVREDMAEFVRQCGTRYVRSVYSGHLLDATVHFALHMDKRTSATASEISLGVEKLFGLSAGDTSAEAKLAEKSSAHLWSQGRGVLALPPALQAAAGGSPPAAGAPAPKANDQKPGDPNPGAPPVPMPPGIGSTVIPGGVTQLIAWYNTGFVAAVEKAVSEKKSAVPLYIDVEGYGGKFRLRNRLSIPSLSEEIADAVVETAGRYGNLITVLSTAHYALEKNAYLPDFPKDLFVEDKAMIDQTAKDGERIFVEYAKALKYCSVLADAGSRKAPDGDPAPASCSARLKAALEPMKDLKLTRK